MILNPKISTGFIAVLQNVLEQANCISSSIRDTHRKRYCCSDAEPGDVLVKKDKLERRRVVLQEERPVGGRNGAFSIRAGKCSQNTSQVLVLERRTPGCSRSNALSD